MRSRDISGTVLGGLVRSAFQTPNLAPKTVCLFITDFSHVIFPQIPLSMNVSTFLAYDQPTISYCGVHHELLSHKSFETNAQEDSMETHLEAELDLSTITAAGRVSDHKQPLA